MSKELADRVVALGVGECQHDKWYGYGHSGDTAEIFVTDWRVAGALMEKCGGLHMHRNLADRWHVYAETNTAVKLPVNHATNQDNHLIRAIIEACTEALEQ